MGRGLAPVVGIVLVLALVLVLGSVFAAGLSNSFGVSGSNDGVTANPGGVETVSGNPWTGSPGDLVRLSTTRAGATDVTYRLNVTIEPGSKTIGNSLNSIYVEVMPRTPDMFSDTDQRDLLHVTVDRGSDGSVEQDITPNVDDWTVKKDGSALEIGLGGAHTTAARESIVVTFSGVQNPDRAGTYDVRAQTSGDGNWHSGTITITG